MDVGREKEMEEEYRVCRHVLWRTESVLNHFNSKLVKLIWNENNFKLTQLFHRELNRF